METIKVKLLCNSFAHGHVSGKKGDVVEVPAPVAQTLIKLKKAEAVK